MTPLEIHESVKLIDGLLLDAGSLTAGPFSLAVRDPVPTVLKNPIRAHNAALTYKLTNPQSTQVLVELFACPDLVLANVDTVAQQSFYLAPGAGTLLWTPPMLDWRDFPGGVVVKLTRQTANDGIVADVTLRRWTLSGA